MTWPAIVTFRGLFVARIECKDRTDRALIRAFRAWAKREGVKMHERYTIAFVDSLGAAR